MSAPIAERPLGVLAITAGLALVGAAVLALARDKTGAIDGREALESAFTRTELPFGFEIVQGALLPDGERIVVLGNPHAEPEAQRTAPAATPETAVAAEDDRSWWQRLMGSPPAEPQPEPPRKDWTKVAIGERGKAPRKAFFSLYPREQGGERVRARFEGQGWRNMRDLDRSGGVVAVDAGKIPWGAYNPDFVHERLYEPGDTFRDSILVNLSVPGSHCIMTLVWPRGFPGSRDAVSTLLATLSPKIDAPKTARQ